MSSPCTAWFNTGGTWASAAIWPRAGSTRSRAPNDAASAAVHAPAASSTASASQRSPSATTPWARPSSTMTRLTAVPPPRTPPPVPPPAARPAGCAGSRVRRAEPLVVDPVLGADEHRAADTRGQRRLTDTHVGGIPHLDAELLHLAARDPSLRLTHVLGIEQRIDRAARDVLDVDARAFP